MSFKALFLPVRRNLQKLFFGNTARKLWLKQKLQRRNLFLSKRHLLLQFIFLLFSLTSFSRGFSQSITINKTNSPLHMVFIELEKLSGYHFFYNETLLQKTNNVTINVKNVSLKDALEICFRNQPVTYAIVDNTVIVKKREEVKNSDQVSAANQIKITVNGKVTNSKGEPIAGATVTVKGTSLGVATKADGSFVLEADEDATLVISSIAHMEEEIKLNKRTSLFISLKEKVNDLDEAIVVAYNMTTQRSNVGSLTVVKGESIQNIPNRSIDKSLQGFVPGLLVTGGTGQPGSGVSNFVLRGIATAVDPSVGSTVRNPLLVIDGVPISQDQFQLSIDGLKNPIANPMAQLNPSDIETITVLKDAVAIALYGSRASNGVIVVTTKKGKTGKTVFSFRHQTDIASRLSGKIDLLNQQEYLDLLMETYRNMNSPLYPNDVAILTDLRKKFPIIVNSPGDTSFYAEPNWYDALYTNNATTISNEFSMSGGNEKNSFYMNLEYTKQNGIVSKTGYDRKSLRFNFENRPASWVKFGLNTTLSYNIQDYSGGTRGNEGPIASAMSLLNPVRYNDGSYVYNYSWGGPQSGGSRFGNPVAMAEYNINRNTAFRGLSKIYGEFSFLKHFKLSTSAGFDFMLAETKEKADPRIADPGNSAATVGRVEEQDLRRANLVTTNILKYDRVFGKHHTVNVLLGQEAQVQTQKRVFLAVQNLALPYYDQINSPGATLLRQGGATTKENLLSFFGQANYGFKRRYLLSASIRRDGSSRFGEDRRYGTYWSTGAGWVVSSEPFMNKISSWINYMKIRGSIGAAGNAGAINAITRYDLLQSAVFLGGTAVYPTSTPGNPDVRWEKTFTWDAGLEVRFLKERIAFTADIYKRNTTDLIYLISLPQSSGYLNVLTNIGEIENKGVELSLSADIIRNKDFSWGVTANWSTNQNKLVKANVPLASIFGNILGNKEGENFNSFYLVRWAGVNPADGEAQWLDSAGNIKTTFPSATANRKLAGKPQPDGFGAVTSRFIYRAFEISIMFYYQYGNKLYIQDNLVNDGFYAYANQDRRALDRWQKPGDVSTNPKRVLNNPDGSTANYSTRYLFDGDYIRLQNLAIAYNFSKKITDWLHLSSLRVYIQGHNLALWTKFPGQDPDMTNLAGSTGATSYPNNRSFSFGVNANF